MFVLAYNLWYFNFKFIMIYKKYKNVKFKIHTPDNDLFSFAQALHI